MSRRIPLQVIDDASDSYYVSERKVYPRDVSGRFNRLRVAAVVWLLGLFYVLPWLTWQGRQAVLLDLPARKFHVFGLLFLPQDFLFLSVLLIIAALALFFFTALAGRLFCGYACPQTVWTEVSLWIERWFEGDRNKRMKLDAGPWTREKILRKTARHTVWVLFSLWTGFTFVGYFSPIGDLVRRTPFDWGGWEAFWILFYAFATWGNAGFLRQQVCKYMCPYARFQSAMFDRNTLIIAYDPMRGEPRGPRKRGLQSVLERARGLLDTVTAYDYVFRASRHPSAADHRAQAGGTIALAGMGDEAEPLPKFTLEELGDCVDCTICVQVCPTGIDIRNGLQYECIACGACIDACNEVMGKVGYPQGLIRYSTQNQIDGKPARVLRPRVFVYGALLLALMGGWLYGVTHRSLLMAEVLRDRNAMYSEAAHGGIQNAYTLKLVNKAQETHRFQIDVISADVPGLELGGGAKTVSADSGEVLSVPVTVMTASEVSGRHDVSFRIRDLDGGASVTVKSSFFGPVP
ncbi:4Fe-4S dicluster domain-containing protein [Dyella japonica]|uniref:(Fe-S)-binding protein n=1 Tax=Dyella japonica A8 TaxID=1217721 RepID=A0A075JY92_9GAMM|nr:4Fe-4S dicluster domain-containing protein [Dyella japonica]AIF46874.1 (Fe-S)-binding protein [Dyella japonica A8]